MKGMRKISLGKGFRGVLNYCCTEGKAKIIGGNMSGKTARELAAEFGLARSLRPDVKKPVWHNSLRLPSGETLTDQKWEKIGDEYMEKMGFTDRHQRVYLLEEHPDGHHIHIAANRISLDGGLYLGKNENLESTRHIQDLEKSYGLQITKGRDELHPTKRKEKSLPKKNEMEMALRVGEQPTRLVLQSILDDALKGRPTTEMYFSNLENEGVIALPNVASTGRVSGLSYSFQGIALKGSDLGKKYGWAALIEGGIDYEQARDASIIAKQKARAFLGDDAGGHRYLEAPGSIIPGTVQSGIESGSDFESGNGFGIASERLGNDARNDQEGNRGNSQGGQGKCPSVECGRNYGRQSGSNDAEIAGSIQRGATHHRNCSEGEQPSRIAQDSGGSDFDLCSVNDGDACMDGKPAWANPSSNTRQQGSSGTDRQKLAPESLGLAKHIEHQLKAWGRFQKALCAKMYRVFWKDRDPKRTHPELHGGKDGPGASGTPHPIRGMQTKAAKEQQGERFWSPDEVAEAIRSGRFAAWNAKKMDMYIRPIDDEFHLIFIDDVRGTAGVKKIKADGYTPALVQESSDGNFQVVLRVPKHGSSEKGTPERIASNRLALNVNQKYGDAGAGRAEQNFRIPGYRNKKSGRKDFVTTIDWGNSSPGAVCERASLELENWRQTVKAEESEHAVIVTQERFTRQLLDLEAKATTPDLKKFAAIFRKWSARKSKHGGGANLSEIDFQAAKELLVVEKWTSERIGAAMLAASPAIEERKGTWTTGYISKTVAAVQKIISEEESPIEAGKSFLGSDQENGASAGLISFGLGK